MSELVKILDETQFNELIQADVPVLIEFGAPWCQPCNAFEPILLGIAKKYSEHITVAKVDIEQLPIASVYNIRTIPHCLLFHKGELLGSRTGLQPQQQVIDFLKENLPMLQESL